MFLDVVAKTRFGQVAAKLQYWYVDAINKGYTIEVAFFSREGEILPHNGLWRV